MSIRKRTPRARGEPIDVDDACLRGWPLPLPTGNADKEARGRLLVIAGSRELGGAAMLAATAALRAGAGKVVVGTARSIAAALSMAVPEARVVALDETDAGGLVIDDALLDRRYDGVLVGPGMMDEDATLALVGRVLDRVGDASVVLDALAMDMLRASRRTSRGRMAVTPHAGELAHLCGADKDAIVRDPVAAARTHAARWGVDVVLKGAVTVIASADGESWWHRGGNIGLAVSGSGDVLAGIIAGLAARGAALEQAAVFGVALHARAGDRLAARHGEVGFLPRELAAEVPRLMHELSMLAR